MPRLKHTLPAREIRPIIMRAVYDNPHGIKTGDLAHLVYPHAAEGSEYDARRSQVSQICRVLLSDGELAKRGTRGDWLPGARVLPPKYRLRGALTPLPIPTSTLHVNGQSEGAVSIDLRRLVIKHGTVAVRAMVDALEAELVGH